MIPTETEHLIRMMSLPKVFAGTRILPGRQQISEEGDDGRMASPVKSRIRYDIGKGRATRLPDGRVQFPLASLADRWVEPCQGQTRELLRRLCAACYFPAIKA